MLGSRRAQQEALPLPRRPFHGSPHGGREGAYRCSPASPLGAALPKIGRRLK